MAKRQGHLNTNTIADLSLETAVEDLRQVVRMAEKDTHAVGHWTSKIRDGRLVRIYPNGDEVVVPRGHR